jgi:hypothetical protein
MISHTGPRALGKDSQCIKVRVDLLPGPLTEAVAEHILEMVGTELRNIGTEVTAVGVEVRGDMASW